MFGSTNGSDTGQRRSLALLWTLVALCVACGRGEGTLALGFVLGGEPGARVTFEVSEGTFSIESRGTVVAGTIAVDVRLIDQASTEVAATTVTFPAATYGVSDGQNAFDRTDVAVIAEEVTEVVVPLEFRWGNTSGALDTIYDIQIAPEMTSWQVVPEPILVEAASLSVTVNVRNYNGPPGTGDVDVAGALFPADGVPGGAGSVAVGLDFDRTEVASGFTEEVYAGALTVPVPQDYRIHLLTLDGTDTRGIAANGAAGCTFVLASRTSAIADDPDDDSAIDVALLDLGGTTEVDVTVKDTTGVRLADAEVHVRERGVVTNRISGRTDESGAFVGFLAPARDGGAVQDIRLCVLYEQNRVFHAVRASRP